MHDGVWRAPLRQILVVRNVTARMLGVVRRGLMVILGISLAFESRRIWM